MGKQPKSTAAGGQKREFILNCEDLQLFMVMLEKNNLVKAAELLYMSPSTAGPRLRAMKKELGSKLFECRRGVKTTPPISKDQEFSRLSVQMPALWNEADQIRHRCKSPLFTIAAVDNFLGHNLIPLYKGLVSTHKFPLDIRYYPTDMIYSLVSGRQADIGFALYCTSCPHVGMVPTMEDGMVLVMPKGQPVFYESSGNHAPVHPFPLAPDKELLAGSRSNSNMGWRPELRLWHDRYINPQARPPVTASSISILTGFLKAEDYWTITPSTAANGLKKQYPISILPLFPPPPGYALYMLTHESPSCVSSSNTELFAWHLREYLEMCSSKGYSMR